MTALKKKFDLRGVKEVLSTLTKTDKQNSKGENDVQESLLASDFFCGKMVRHGFPHHPTCMAWDPIQKLLAIGTRHGTVRLLGKPGVDLTIQHSKDVIVLQIAFLINEGALITVCSDDTINLWNFRQKIPEIVNTLKFSRERITCLHLPFQSQYLYLGTERGNVHIVNVSTFTVYGYTINWNKAIELARKTHPGPVVHLSENPLDPGRLLIGFESGLIVCWDLRCKMAEYRYHCSDSLRDACWHQEGKQFMCSCADGTISIWNYRQQNKPASQISPHSKTLKSGERSACKPINRCAWKTMKNKDPYIIFSGGMSYENSTKAPCITLIHGKSTTVLEMEHQIIDFQVLSNNVYKHEYQDPYAIIVLLSSDLIFVDLTSPGYPCFQCPYPLDIHESPVTCLKYYSDCASDLIPAFYSCGVKQKRKGLSDKEFPVAGGQWGSYACSYSEILITGHADGTVKFWDVSGINLQFLYKLKSSKIFERQKKDKNDDDEDLFAIQHIYLDEESRLLAIASSQHIILYSFSKKEMNKEPTVIDVTVLNEVFEELNETPDEVMTSEPQTNNTLNKETISSVKVKPGSRKFGVGYQPDLVTVLKWCSGTSVPNITYVCVNSSYGLLGIGTTTSLLIVDIVQKNCILNILPADLTNANSMAARPQTGALSPKNRLQSSSNSTDEVQFRDDQSKQESSEVSPERSSRAGYPLNRAKSTSTPSIAEDRILENDEQCPLRTVATAPTHIRLAKAHSDSPNGNSSANCGPPITEPNKTSGVFNKLRRLSMKSTVRKPANRPLTAQPTSTPFFSDQRTPASSTDLKPTKPEKTDNLARSRSSSSNSIDTVANDSVQFIMFADGYTNKQDQETTPGLWIGTSNGHVIAMNLSLPGSERASQPVVISHSGSTYSIKGSILELCFLDFKGLLVPVEAEVWNDGRSVSSERREKRLVSRLSRNTISGDSSDRTCDKHIVIIGTDSEVRSIALPSQNTLSKGQIPENMFVVKSQAIVMKDSVCYACLGSTGHLLIFSLPSLRILMNVEYINQFDVRVARTLDFGNHGQAVYMCTPTEIQKLTISAETCRAQSEMQCEPFIAKANPEPPKQSFLQNLFGSTPSQLDREELFGQSGKASSGIATVTPGSALQAAHANATGVAGDVARARQALVERGEKLGRLDQRTENMKEQAKEFSKHAAQLANKYQKDAKWYDW